MFKKLKEKITEEVKISPQRFAEFTQSVSDRLQNSSTSDENFFSIGDDDANSSAASTNSHGFSSVTLMSPSQEIRTRKNSTSSIASDVSFLPRYEAGTAYHLQSDLDISASELEDNASTSSSQIGHLSKEQIYAAFQKSQMRYHKYRGRFTDLSRHYKDLEREITKMKAVLVETQDKAIRRVAELKEQCILEQKAKAHLESAMRDEIDEKNYKITSLQTKIELLQKDAGSNKLVQVEDTTNDYAGDLENTRKHLNEARKEIDSLNVKVQEFKANAIVFQSKEQEYKAKIGSLEREIVQFSEREKENNLKLAENKMELHKELSSKEKEIAELNSEMENLKQSLENERKTNASVKMENLLGQNKKLIEKVESLTQKSNNLENELLKVEAYKLEMQDLKQKQAKLDEEITELRKINVEKDATIQKLCNEKQQLLENSEKERKQFENEISSLREDAKKGLLSLEMKIKEKLQNDFEHKEQQLKQDFATKLEELSSKDNNDKKIHLQLFEKDKLLEKASQELEEVKSQLACQLEDYKTLEKNHLELIEDCTRLRKGISNLEKEKTDVEAHQDKVSRLEAHINTLQEELKQSEEKLGRKERENLSFSRENFNLLQDLGRSDEQLRILQVKDEAIELDSSENKMLELKLQQLEQEQNSLLSEFEMERKMFNDLLENHKEVKEKEIEIDRLKEELKLLKSTLDEEMAKNVQINDEKLDLERAEAKLQEQLRIFQEKDEAVNLDKTECGILELKLQKLEEDKAKLLETFELERKIFAEHLDLFKRDLKADEEENDDKDLQEKLMDVKRLLEAKEATNVDMSKELVELQRENALLLQQMRVLEEKLEAIDMEGVESKLLEVKLEKLEGEKEQLMQQLEKERETFKHLLENHKELQEKEAMITQLEEALREDRSKVDKLESLLTEEKNENVRLAKEKLLVDKQVVKLEEQIRLFQEKEELVEIDKNECGILELKLQQLEMERQTLLDTFELERAAFNKTTEDNCKNAKKVEELQGENWTLKEAIEQGKEEMKQLVQEVSHHHRQHEEATVAAKDLLNKIKEMDKEIQSLQLSLTASEEKCKSTMDSVNILTATNDKLREELLEKDREMMQLSQNVQKLSQVIEKQTVEFKELLTRTQQLDVMLEKAKSASFAAVGKEKQLQNDLRKKIEELEAKNAELATFEGKFAEEKKKVEELAKKLEESVIIADKDRKVMEDRLKANENELKDKMTQLKENHILQEERDNLLAEILSLRSNLAELNKENGNLRSELASKNEAHTKLVHLEKDHDLLQKETAKSKEEISELIVRVQQISADNQNFVEENQNLMHNNEELKIKLEGLESEKSTRNGGDLVEIQQNFHDIKEKCDKLFVENKNLKAEYDKLEEKCNNFGGIKKKLEAQLAELEMQYNEILHEKQLLQDEIQELKTSPLNYQSNSSSQRLDQLQILKKEEELQRVGRLEEEEKELQNGGKHEKEEEELLQGGDNEIELLKDKLTKYKSLDLTNKSSIQFYENELQKMRNQNEKLSRRLDETLVTLNHCTELSSTSTEVEYLRNVLYNYMLGKESVVLARVIAAVCKFDEEQTEAVLQKEQQKQTLLGQLGLI